MAGKLHVVHCVDTEGPLYEPLSATFERLEQMTGVAIAPTYENLERIRGGDLDLGGTEEAARVAFAPHLLAYNDTWDAIDEMLAEMMSPAFRERFADPAGRPWTINWFCVDHVGYDVNPRRRDMGFHNVFDHYLEVLSNYDVPDEIHWHVHPMPTYREAHRNATSYLRSPHILETLSRRIIDRSWFPVAFRPGFHVERPDSHWLLEQFVPFDFGNQSMQETALEAAQRDLAGGRFGDWRRAPDDWSHYHPHHDDYQRQGSCRRVIFRCLNVGTRLRLLNESEVRKAFVRARSGYETVMAFTNHDFRDMRPDVQAVHTLVSRVAEEFPDVEWRNSSALVAARSALGLMAEEPLRLDADLRRNGGQWVMSVTANHDTFGPQPFLAVKSHDQVYSFDNLDVQRPFREWTYVFDEHTFRPAAIEAIGVAAADCAGHTSVLVLNPSDSLDN